MDTCLKSVNVNMEIVIIRKNKTVLDAEICPWSKVDGHSLFSNRDEFNLNPTDFDMGNTRLPRPLRWRFRLNTEVGFFQDSRYPDGTPVTNIAAWNEFGTSRGIPERPFFRLAIAGAEDELLALLKRELDPKTLAIDQQLADRVGVDSQASTVLDRHVPSSYIVDARALRDTLQRRILSTPTSTC